jgi:hypothetical protein
VAVLAAGEVPPRIFEDPHYPDAPFIGFLLSGRESQTGGVRNWDIRFRRNCLRFDARSATICHWGGLS